MYSGGYMRAVIVASNPQKGRYIAESESNKIFCFEAPGLDVSDGDQVKGDFSFGKARLVCFGNLCIDVSIVFEDANYQEALSWLGKNSPHD